MFTGATKSKTARTRNHDKQTLDAPIILPVIQQQHHGSSTECSNSLCNTWFAGLYRAKEIRPGYGTVSHCPLSRGTVVVYFIVALNADLCTTAFSTTGSFASAPLHCQARSVLATSRASPEPNYLNSLLIAITFSSPTELAKPASVYASIVQDGLWFKVQF